MSFRYSGVCPSPSSDAPVLLIVIIIVGGTVLVLAVIAVLCWTRRRDGSNPEASDNEEV